MRKEERTSLLTLSGSFLGKYRVRTVAKDVKNKLEAMYPGAEVELDEESSWISTTIWIKIRKVPDYQVRSIYRQISRMENFDE